MRSIRECNVLHRWPNYQLWGLFIKNVTELSITLHLTQQWDITNPSNWQWHNKTKDFKPSNGGRIKHRFFNENRSSVQKPKLCKRSEWDANFTLPLQMFKSFPFSPDSIRLSRVIHLNLASLSMGYFALYASHSYAVKLCWTTCISPCFLPQYTKSRTVVSHHCFLRFFIQVYHNGTLWLRKPL